MNELLKELAEQAGLQPYYDKEFIRFAELVRLDERDKCVRLFARLNCDAVDAARLEEREAIAALVEADGRVHPKAPDAVWAKTVAKLIRARR
jgi:hypothetical protein